MPTHRLDFDSTLKLMDAAISSLDPNELLLSLVRCLADIVCADAAAGLLYVNNELVVRAGMPSGADSIKPKRVKLREGLVGSSAYLRRALHVPDTSARVAIDCECVLEFEARSLTAVPLLNKDDLVGVLALGWSEKHECDELELRLLEQLGERCASALVNAQEHQLVKEAQRLDGALNDIAVTMNSTRDVDEIMRKVVVDAAQAMGCETAAIDMRCDGGWIPQYVYNFPEESIGKRFTDAEVPFAALAAQTHQVIAISDCESDDRVDKAVQNAYCVRSVLLAPLLIKDAVIGAIFFNYHSCSVQFTQPQIDFAHRLACALALAMDNARLYESLELSEQVEKEQRRFVEMLLDSAPIGIAVVRGADFRFELANKWFTSVCSPGGELIPGRRFADVFPDMVEQGNMAHLDTVYGTGKTVRVREMRRTSGPGKQPNHWDVHYVPLKGEDGNVKRIMILARDVTKEVGNRLNVQALARRSIEELSKREAILSSMTDGLIIFDMRGRIVDMNPAALRMHHYGGSDEIARHLTELSETFVLRDMNDALLPVESWPMSRVLRGETFTDFEVRVRNLITTEERAWSYSGTVARDAEGRIELGILTLRDITDLKQAQAALARSREEAEHRAAQQESLVAGLADGIALVDESGKIILVNQAAKELIGWREDAKVWDWLRDFERYSLDGTPFPLSQTAAYRALRGETVRDCRYRIISPTGQNRIISAGASPVKDVTGRIIGATNIMRDVTDEVEFERRRTEMYEREHRISTVLQEALIPSDVPRTIGNYEIAVRYKPALQEALVGGDFYDVFELGDGKFGVLIGDVAGKGLAAAIRVAAVRHSIRSYAYLDPQPARVMTLTNDALCRDDDDLAGMLTAFFAVVDTSSGAITYACAGHEPPILAAANDDFKDLGLGSFPLGVAPGVVYTEMCDTIAPGATLLMVTDGITEARVFAGELFGRKGLTRCLVDKRGESSEELAQHLLDSAVQHADGSLHDDAAIIVLKRTDYGTRQNDT